MEELFYPSAFWYGWDFKSGYTGIEKFHFGIYEIDGQTYDFSSGLYDIAITNETLGQFETNATLTILTVSEDLFFEDIELASYTFTFPADFQGDYAWMPVIELDPETLSYTKKPSGEEILYYD